MISIYVRQGDVLLAFELFQMMQAAEFRICSNEYSYGSLSAVCSASPELNDSDLCPIEQIPRLQQMVFQVICTWVVLWSVLLLD